MTLRKLKSMLPQRVTIYWGDAWSSSLSLGEEPGQDKTHPRASTGYLVGITSEIFQMSPDFELESDQTGVKKPLATEISGVPIGWVRKVEILGVSETIVLDVKVTERKRRGKAKA